MRWREVLFPSSNSDIWKSVVLLVKSAHEFQFAKGVVPCHRIPQFYQAKGALSSYTPAHYKTMLAVMSPGTCPGGHRIAQTDRFVLSPAPAGIEILTYHLVAQGFR